jgi:anti-sigma regulatory factor (Ser/Thr protein kinase)
VSKAPGNQSKARGAGPRRVDKELRVSLTRASEVAGFRRDLRAMLRGTRLAGADREAVVLAATEAVENALLACRERVCTVEAAVSLVAGYVCVEIRDAGDGFGGVCVEPAGLAGETDEHGRGLHLMHELMESLELVPRSQGTLVRMTKRLGLCDSTEVGADSERLAC